MELANYITTHANNIIVFGIFFGYASWAIYIGVNDKKKRKERARARAIQALIQDTETPPANDPLKVGDYVHTRNGNGSLQLGEIPRVITKISPCGLFAELGFTPATLCGWFEIRRIRKINR